MDQTQGTAGTKARGREGTLRAISRAASGATTRTRTGEVAWGRSLGRARPPLPQKRGRSAALICSDAGNEIQRL